MEIGLKKVIFEGNENGSLLGQKFVLRKEKKTLLSDDKHFP